MKFVYINEIGDSLEQYMNFIDNFPANDIYEIISFILNQIDEK